MLYLAAKPVSNINFSQSLSNVVKAPAPRPPQLPPMQYAAVAQAVTHTSTPSVISSSTHPQTTTPLPSQPSPLITAPPPPVAITQDQSPISASSPSLTNPSVTSPVLSSSAASASQHLEGSTYSVEDSPALSEAPLTTSQQLPSPQKAVPKGNEVMHIL